MAGYNKEIVLEGVRQELERATHGADKKFDADLAAWMERRELIKKAQARVKKLVTELQDLTPQEAAKKITSATGRGYGSDDFVGVASGEVSQIPARVPSARERALTNVIAIVESHDQPTVSLVDLRALGVLDFIKYSENAC